jgi:hypothetical protein
MPELSRFYGIRITMNWDDHNPPHFHAKHGSYSASIDLDGNIISGYLPVTQKRQVLGWLEIHREELYKNWEKAENMEELCKIEPLK